jgi:ankyrin repeat protein
MESLKQNYKKFTLLENLTEYELDQLEGPIINQDLKDLLEHNINQENIYRILYLYDFYQYNKHEFIEQIQFMILDGNLIIDYDKLNKEDLYNSIFCNDCLRNCKISCNLKEKIHDVICVKYLIKNNHKVGECAINLAALNGHLETVKYLHELGYKGNKHAIIWAAENGHIKTLKYLHELGYKCDEYTINWAARNGYIETLKYLHELGYKGNKYAINYAAENGHIETLKYLHELGYKGDEWAINLASHKGQLETIKYLHELDYKGNENTINFAACMGHIEIVKYLLENNYNFTQSVIDDAKIDEIEQLLKDNIHLLKNDN